LSQAVRFSDGRPRALVMFRLSLHARSSARCLYTVLGISRGATDAEIKLAFREKAKQTHPDVANGGGAASDFRQLIEAYRVLRDPGKRRRYDLGEDVGERASAGQASTPRGQRARQQTYAGGQAPPVSSASFLGPNAGAATAVVLGSFLFLRFRDAEEQKSLAEHYDPHPSRSPKQVSTPSPAVVSSGVATAPSADQLEQQNQESLVRAFYDPYSQRWMSIPEGYDPPGPMDLTDWHKKRIDPAEWSRQFVDGTLSRIQPRGALQVRLRPKWDTFDAIIVRDISTKRTVMNPKMRAAGFNAMPTAADACEIKF